MICVDHISKRYGATVAVDDLSFEVRPGVVTGFLGPNGAGKSTTMRMIVGLDVPSKGRATIDGKPFSELDWPLRTVGALLDAKSAHPGRPAYWHLRALAESNAIPLERVDAVLELVGLSSVARRRPKQYSLGMSQRLGIATALLGDPEVIILDEPINGLDPEGILWVRNLLRSLAAEGRTVLVSSHLMSEMALTADDLVVIGRGRLLAHCSVEDFIAQNTESSFAVRSSDDARLAQLLTSAGASIERSEQALVVTELDEFAIGDAARDASIALYELSAQRPSLEEVFMELTADSVTYAGKAEVPK